MAAFAIRRADHLDEAFLFEMLYQSLYAPDGSDPFPRSVLDAPEIADYALGFGTRPGDIGVIATGTVGDSIGAAWARLPFGEHRGYGYVDDDTPELSMAVVAAHRGNGVGTALLGGLLESVPEMSLSVDARNPALRLYTRFGFGIVGDDGNSFTMVRRASTESG